MVTREFFSNQTLAPTNLKDKRPFIVSRSTFAGSGAFVAHGLGQNHRDWESMIQSVSEVFNFNMFGIPMTGSTACGYYGASNDELCARWIQQNSFFPMSKVHRAADDNDGSPNAPTELSAPWNSIAKNAILNRMSYIRQLYTCIFEVSQNGGTCIDPLFYWYPTDERTMDVLNVMEKSFVVAESLVVIPISQQYVNDKTVQ